MATYPVLHALVIFIRRYLNRLIHIPYPDLIVGEGKLALTINELQKRCATKCLLVSDQVLTELGFVHRLESLLKENGIEVVLFNQVTPDPSVTLVEHGGELYRENACDAVVALGGGSVIDCAKAIAAIGVSGKSIKQLAGLFRIRRKLPPLIAIPTTAGTGSEATLVAVITDAEKRKKFTVIDPYLVPAVAILDADLMKGLPPAITAHTGMDALTHAIESYIGLHGSAQTKHYCLAAIAKIFNFLPKAYHQGGGSEAREAMAQASYEAGLAFTRTSVGYVHAIAHQLGAIYHIPHGLANAVVLPHVLDFSFDHAYPAYAELAYHLKLVTQATDKRQAATTFITAVKSLAEQLKIPKTFSELKAQDIDEIARRAIKEAHCDYPVPKQMSVAQCRHLLEKLLAR